MHRRIGLRHGNNLVKMLRPGPAKKVTVHLNEDTSAESDFIYEQVFRFLLEKGVAGATLIRPSEGFGTHRHRHSEGAMGSAGDHLPVRIEFIDTPEVVASLLPSLCDLVRDGLIDVQDTTVVKAARKETPF